MLRSSISLSARLCAALLLAAVVLSWFGSYSRFFDGISHFRPQYLVAAIICLPGALLTRERRTQWAAVAIGTVLLNAIAVLPWYLPHRGKRTDSRIRICLANIHTHNSKYAEFLKFVQETKPDVLVVLEINKAWKKQLAALHSTLPHSVFRPRSDNFGIAVLSKHPFLEKKILSLGGSEVPTVVVSVRKDRRTVAVIGTHTLPPVASSYFDTRNAHLSSLASYAKTLEGPLIVAGDLNTSMWSPHYVKMMSKSALRNARRGHGIFPTWPTDAPWFLRIPIDHVLHSSHLVSDAVRTEHIAGSDHLAVVADLVFLRP